MRNRLKDFTINAAVLISVVSLVFISCSSDNNNPVRTSDVTWRTYDNFDANVVNDSLWTPTITHGGQVLDTSGQLEVWGNTDTWTGSGNAISTKPKLGWKFTLVDTYYEDGGGCQGWSVWAVDPTENVGIELLNRVTAGCTSNLGDSAGVYEVTHEGDSLAVYKNGSLLRRFYSNGITYFMIRFYDTNVYGDGTHSHIIVDNVQGLEWSGWTP